MFAYLRAAVVPTAVFAATDDWGSDEAGVLDARIPPGGADLAWAIGASRRQSQQTGALPAVTDFAALLGGLGIADAVPLSTSAGRRSSRGPTPRTGCRSCS